jgi:hypothetical protein
MKLKRLFSLLVLVIVIPLLTTCAAPSSDQSSKPHEYGQEIRLVNPPSSLDVLKLAIVPVSVRNTSNFDWPASGNRPVHLSYHWLDKGGKVIVHDGERTPLGNDLPAGATAEVNAIVKGPPTPGDYTLLFTFVEEGVRWFNVKDAKAVDIAAKVESK